VFTTIIITFACIWGDIPKEQIVRGDWRRNCVEKNGPDLAADWVRELE